MIINRLYENQNLLSLQLFYFLVGLRTYRHPLYHMYQSFQNHCVELLVRSVPSYTLPGITSFEYVLRLCYALRIVQKNSETHMLIILLPL
jgi:hypothetical protein